jgi:hypothetical protein
MNELQQAASRLKKTTTRDSSTQLLEERTQDANEWFSTNMEVWYNSLKDFTFPTLFITLSHEELEAMLAPNEHKQRIVDIATKIDESVQQMGGKAFVKMSCRSAKDSMVTCDEMKQIYHQNVKEDMTENEKMILLNYAYLQAMGVTSGSKALDYLLKSQRIAEDLQLAKKNNTEMQIIVRKWEDIPLKHEFRCFIFKRTLTAVSQYFDLCFFKALENEKESLLASLVHKFEEVKHRVPLENYILDFGISTDGKVHIIELNPFTTTTDSCLFSWTSDKRVLFGEEPLQMRIREREMKNLKQCIIAPWKEYL